MKLLTPFNCNSVNPGTTCEKLEAQSPHSRDRAPGGCLSPWPPPSPSCFHLFLSYSLAPLLPFSFLISTEIFHYCPILQLLQESASWLSCSPCRPALQEEHHPTPPSPAWLSAGHLAEHWRRTALLQLAEDGEGKALGSPGTLLQSRVGCFMTT